MAGTTTTSTRFLLLNDPVDGESCLKTRFDDVKQAQTMKKLIEDSLTTIQFSVPWTIQYINQHQFYVERKTVTEKTPTQFLETVNQRYITDWFLEGNTDDEAILKAAEDVSSLNPSLAGKIRRSVAKHPPDLD